MAFGSRSSPAHVIDVVEASLKGQALVAPESVCEITRSLPHGHVAAVGAMARTLGLPALLGPRCRSRDLVLGLIISRVLRPASKLATLAWWADTTLGEDLNVTNASTGEIYEAMDWLLARQDAIEKQLAAKHLAASVNPSRMALFDLSSSWMTGQCCDLAARGYSRDGKKGLPQIEYGLLTDPAGRPVAIRVFAGNTADPAAFTDIVEVVRERFGLDRLVLVGDRGMITSARIAALRELNNDPDTATGFGWITALRAPAIAKLAGDDGPLQLSLFDTQDLATITHPDYPSERLIACRNPLLATQRARKRAELLTATEAALAPIIAAVACGRLAGAGRIGVKVGKVLAKFKMAKHFHLDITDTTLTVTRDQTKIDAEAALDGIYVLRTSVTANELDPAAVVVSYKNLANVERDFRSIKTDDLDLRPIHHRLDDRVKAHILIAMLACYLVWHLRKAWAPMTYTDENPPARENPVAPAQRSAAAKTKAARHQDANGATLRSFSGLLEHLATLTRNDVNFTHTTNPIPMLATPPPTNNAPLTSSEPPSPSPAPRSHQRQPTKPQNPQVNS
ncbi:transposase (plasmid) [Mycobacterium liflandii 128FXT]|uniref:Transposase n=1 Tax=Mycobacterium liflandii (strain 128FXT) TaxID=459424 RepID=B6CLX6_MYCL1|nr:transposase [Mycobacterium ulcerans]ACA57613.1 transposase [Mycobacterium liflandii 128FXT]